MLGICKHNAVHGTRVPAAIVQFKHVISVFVSRATDSLPIPAEVFASVNLSTISYPIAKKHFDPRKLTKF